MSRLAMMGAGPSNMGTLTDQFLASQIGTVNVNNLDFTTISGLIEPDSRRIILCVAGHNGAVAALHTALKINAGAGSALSNIAGLGATPNTANNNYISAWVAGWGPGAGSSFPLPQLQLDAAPARGWIDFYQFGRAGAPTQVQNAVSASAASVSLNIDVPAGGLVVAFVQTTTGANSVTWTGATKNSDSLVSATTWRSSAWYQNAGGAETARPITATFGVNPSSNIRMLALAFGAKT